MKALLILRSIWLSIFFLVILAVSVNIQQVRADGLNNNGTIVIKGNLVNLKTTMTNLGTGLFEFSGTAAQTISGPNQFTNLTINNAAGVSLTGTKDNKIVGTLTLTSGLLTINDLNLLMGPASDVAGPPSASSMVVATGTGELRKEFSNSAPGFTYPVGNAGSPAEYSPVTAAFTSGTFGTDNFLGVNLKDSPDPDLPISTENDYLERYWTLNNSNITGTISCDLTFKFVPADLNSGGNLSNIWCVKTSPVLETYNKYSGGYNLTATVSGFGTFTGADAALEATFTAFMEGPYNAITGSMTTSLPAFSDFPTTQPYSGSPWFYPGSETVGTTVPAGVVDWVLIELRQADIPDNATLGTVIATRAALLKTNGAIVDVDGSGNIKFFNAAVTQNLYPVIRHRNHLAIMANYAALKTDGIYTYNYTTGSNQIFGGGKIQLGSLWGMIAGDANGDGTIQTDDKTIWSNTFNADGYLPADFTMDHAVMTGDKSLWVQNFNKDSTVP